MKTKLKLFQAGLVCAVALGIGSSFSLTAAAADSADPAPAKTSQAIPWSQLGVPQGGTGVDYQGDGLAVSPTADGARLRCVFQRLEGEATREGLWLTSSVIPPSGTANDRFRVVAVALGRQSSMVGTRSTASPLFQAKSGTRWNASLPAIANTGMVAIDGQIVRFTRPGLVEEYSVSMDGVRQDFRVLERPGGAGDLAVRLAVSGVPPCGIEPAAFGAQLVLENSGRRIAYSRLRATDATGKELIARMEVLETKSEIRTSVVKSTMEVRKQKAEIAVVVNDAEAVYPIRIDPTFSDANWISMNPSITGADNPVFAAVLDGSGNLYIGGEFTVIGDVGANHVAKWDGSSWSALGSGIGGNVYALAASGTDLYAGSDCVAKWDGRGWSALGSGMNDLVFALAVSGSNVYAGGRFTTAGGSAANSIAKWNGTSWSALGSGMSGGPFPFVDVSALAVSGANVYAGGTFTTAGGSAANYIARWNGSSWSAVGSGMDQFVFALAVSGSDLYAGGYGISKWDGSSWTPLGSGVDGVHALAVSGANVYAGGYFTTAGGSAANYIAKWNGSSWTALGSGMGDTGYTPPVGALAVSGSNVYAGGDFRTAGGSPANYVAKWNGSSWSALGSPGSGMNRGVSALAVSGNDLYAGGNFTNAGGSAANYIARWSGSSWTALGSGMNGGVGALAVSGSDLYAGGYFTTAGGSAATNIAKWNGSSWSALGSGISGGNGVGALAVLGSDLYAGGSFGTAGGSPANSIAKWDGSSWSALGSGIEAVGCGFGVCVTNSGDVYALAVSGSDMYAGGLFTTAGGSEAYKIAKWNGTGWSALGSGMDGYVYALAVSGSNVYAGGEFTTAGGSEAYIIAKWNGSSWSALGSGISGNVRALAVSGSDLYAGGVFTFAGGSNANYIAKWNGSSWTALGSGLNSQVNALAVSGSDLYAGGTFTTAGGKVSAYVARAIVNPPVLAIEGDGDGGYFIRFSGVPGSDYRLQRAPGLTGPWATSSPQTAPASGLVEFWDLFPPPGQAFYRTVQP